MKKITLLGILLLFPFYSQLLRAEDVAEELLAKMDTIFEHIDRSRIETGLLSDYGCFFSDPSLYDGTLNEDNYVTLHDWQMLYASMYASQVNDKVSLEEPSSVFERSEAAPSLLYLQYNEIDTTAFDRGLLSVVDDQLHESGSESPYLTKELFAAAFPDAEYDNLISLVFSSGNYITNVDELPALSIWYSGSLAYRTVQWDEPVSMFFNPYIVGNERTIRVRLTFKDGKTMESHAKIRVKHGGGLSEGINSGTTCVDDSFRIEPTASHDGGWVYIKYANFNTTRKLIRPLIIADEMDLSPYGLGSDVDLDYVVDKLAGLSEGSSEEFDISALFDLVYVNNDNGLDDICRNAKLFQEALQEINSRRYTLHDQSYVVGLGMGGLVASYALSDMEQQGKAHDVQKLLTVNSPHRGLNLPLGMQALLQHLRNLKFLGIGMPAEVKNMAKMLDQKAMQQLLVYSIDEDLKAQNVYAGFMQKYIGKGIPAQCETVAISNGSTYGGLLFPYTQELLFKANRKLAPKVILTARLLKQKEKEEVYDCTIKVLGINAKKNKSFYSTDDMQAIDRAYGSYFPTDIIPLPDEVAKIKLKDAFKVDKFCFVPTVSALAIDNWEDCLFTELDLETVDSDFDRLYAASSYSNFSYLDLVSCKDALLHELVPRIEGDGWQVLGEREFSLVNVPSMLPCVWSFSNADFKVVSQSGTHAVVAPLHFNASANLNVSASLPGITSFSYSTEVRNSVSIEGEPYITSVESRYGLSPMPEDVTVDWRVSENVVIDEEHNNYAIAHLKNVQDGTWIEAVVTTPYGTESVVRLDLFSNNITSITMTEYKDPWWEDNRKHYYFHVDYEPKDIPVEQLSFCWSNTVQIDGSFMTQLMGRAEMETEGTVGICRHFPFDDIRDDLVGDSLRRPPFVIGGGGSPIISPTSNDKPDPIDPNDPIKILPTGVNYCEVIMPAIDTNESASGQVRCMVSDNNGKVLSVSYDVSVEYHTIYHTAPNPADTELIVTQETMNGSTVASTFSMEPEEVALQLYNDFGMVRREMVDWSSGEARMSTADLPEGTYYLHILKGDAVIDRKIVFIEH